jgi:YhfZ C-terminal domain
VRGSRQRLQAVRDGRCHLAVMSSFAASELCGSEDSVVVELPPLTYNTGHRVFYTPTGADSDPLSVIIDRHSADQQLLTNLEFNGANVRLLPAMGSQIARLLGEGHGDAAVWTIDEMRVRWPDGVLDRPLSESVREQVGDRDTRAVLVGRRRDAAVLGAITASIDGEEVERIQLDVMNSRIVPEY